MNKYFSLLAFGLVFFLSGCTNNTVSKNTIAMDKALFTLAQDIRIEPPQEFQKLVKQENYTIIDLRTPEELLPENGGKAFKNAINIDYNAQNFESEIDKLDPTKSYLVHCRSGGRSGRALETFREKGFAKVIDLKGGKIAWDKFLRTNN